MAIEDFAVGLPSECGMPQLDREYGILWSNCFLAAVFGNNFGKSIRFLKCRTMLVHLIRKAARHYQEARELFVAQLAEAAIPSDVKARRGQGLQLLDFPLAFEDCINAIHRARNVLGTILQMENSASAHDFLRSKAIELSLIEKFRHAMEHSNKSLLTDNYESGPILVTVSQDGNYAVLGHLKISFASVNDTLSTFHDVAGSLLPGSYPAK